MQQPQNTKKDAVSMTITKSAAASRGHCVREFDRSKAGAEGTQDFSLMTEEQKKYDIHFTGVAYDRRYSVVWCGFCSFGGDLLWTFDPKTKQFESKGFTRVGEEHEIKIHRGLQAGPDGCLYFGTAALVSTQQHFEAAGGRLFRYDPSSDKYECLGRPIERDYIQNIDIDYQRGIIYGTTYPTPWFFGWDMAGGKLLFKALLSDHPHQVCVDDDGRCWAHYAPRPWDVRRHHLVNYDPAAGKINWTDVRVPGAGSLNDAAGEAGQSDTDIDSFINGGDGFLYMGVSTGALLRLDPRAGKIDMVIKPATSNGFGALSPPVDGKIYGIAGTYTTAEVFSYDLDSRDVVLYGPAYDAERDTTICRPHELVRGPENRLYCPETDNFERQCYFWEIELK